MVCSECDGLGAEVCSAAPPSDVKGHSVICCYGNNLSNTIGLNPALNSGIWLEFRVGHDTSSASLAPE